MTPKKILVTGASGYVGGRLVPELIDAGHIVHCTARNPSYLYHKVPKSTQVFKADLLDLESLIDAFDGCDVAYYLAHALGAKDNWEEMEATMIRNFITATQKTKVKKIIYLGGLVSNSSHQISAHFETRLHTEDVIQKSDIPSLCFRASIILGKGSLSFDLIRSLVDRLPIMVIPKWVRMKAQPIHVDDVIRYLCAAIETPTSNSDIIEIGGPDVVSYLDIMKSYATFTKKRRLFISVPLLTLHLSSLWLGLITPIYARIGRKLIESITVNSVISNPNAKTLFPSITPLGFESALKVACQSDTPPKIAWFNAITSSGYTPSTVRAPNNPNLLSLSCTVKCEASDTQKVFAPIRQIGGKNGWYFATVLWVLRGWIDMLIGGVGLRRGRRDPDQLTVGDTVDWWRVEQYEDGQHLLLRAEMKVPGTAWLEYRLSRDEDGKHVLQQTAIFEPFGIWGKAYWYALYPIHLIIFKGMAHAVQHRSSL